MGWTYKGENEAHLLLKPAKYSEELVVRLHRVALHLVKLLGRAVSSVYLHMLRLTKC